MEKHTHTRWYKCHHANATNVYYVPLNGWILCVTFPLNMFFLFHYDLCCWERINFLTYYSDKSLNCKWTYFPFFIEDLRKWEKFLIEKKSSPRPFSQTDICLMIHVRPICSPSLPHSQWWQRYYKIRANKGGAWILTLKTNASEKHINEIIKRHTKNRVQRISSRTRNSFS